MTIRVIGLEHAFRKFRIPLFNSPMWFTIVGWFSETNSITHSLRKYTVVLQIQKKIIFLLFELVFMRL